MSEDRLPLSSLPLGDQVCFSKSLYANDYDDARYIRHQRQPELLLKDGNNRWAGRIIRGSKGRRKPLC